MDEDLNEKSKDALIREVIRLRDGIRAHRDSSGHDLCWYHPDLWGLLPEKTDPLPSVPEWPKFMEGCLKYRQSLDIQAEDAPRTRESFEKNPHSRCDSRHGLLRLQNVNNLSSQPDGPLCHPSRGSLPDGS